MPRVKPLVTKRGEQLAQLLFGAMSVQERNYSDVAAVVEMSAGTLRRRKRNPEDFTLGEILGIAKTLHIPIEDVRQAIRY